MALDVTWNSALPSSPPINFPGGPYVDRWKDKKKKKKGWLDRRRRAEPA